MQPGHHMFMLSLKIGNLWDKIKNRIMTSVREHFNFI
jgi:hypothetical protein